MTCSTTAGWLGCSRRTPASPSSPHGGAGTVSASITQADKGVLFHLGQDFNVDLTASVVKHLNAVESRTKTP
jgi:hypothetical protein